MYFLKLLNLGFAPIASTVVPAYRSKRLEDVCRVFMPWENRRVTPRHGEVFTHGGDHIARRSTDLTAKAACHGVFR
ncbi:hypothetical protein [Halomonas sp. BC04]|uniref:hypothetical protein n=1 Tax=Halomonas sp. BC04 TaxID=1403540 RepID=UPI0003ED69E5|nr:hypothetical protein [Halomonas sp. BC04]EWG98605.1 hypothetical protein Q427_29620 [Halomonas sp. BC04]